MNDELVHSVMEEVMRSINEAVASDAPNVSKAVESTESKGKNSPKSESAVNVSSENCTLTEFVGTSVGHTIGLVIANLDSQVHEKFEIDPSYRAIGIVGSRCGAAPQIFAADEAVKATNATVVRVELARDMEGGAGHGCLIIFGAEDVSDARRSVEVCLKALESKFGEVYRNSAGHLQFQYTARASAVLNLAFGAEVGKSFGITVGAPAAIGVLMADAAAKSAVMDVKKVGTPGNGGTSFSNEVTLAFSGDSGAVKQAIVSAREVGMQLLKAMEPNEELRSASQPYIL